MRGSKSIDPQHERERGEVNENGVNVSTPLPHEA